MKRFLCLSLIIAIFTVSAPLIALPDSDGPLIDIEKMTEKEETTTEVKTENRKEKKEEKDKTVKVFSSADSTVSTVDEKEYIIGCVAGEMPVTYDEEALKAQAVACCTFLKWKQSQPKDETLNGADIKDSQAHQHYLTREQMEQKWGKDYEKYYKKLSAAVEKVYGKVITYKNEPVMAVFHALSSGKTEDAKNVWGYEVPYLKSVSSEGDKLSPAFSTTLVLSADELKNLLSKEYEIDFSSDAENWIKETDRTDAGTVTKITICNKDFTGEQIRNALSLKSAAFTVKFTENSFIFSVSGYGHFVGMSQYGANYMAQQGFKYDEILKHYYTGVEIE